MVVMMFSSNQVLQISGSIEHDGELEHALQFAIEADGCIESLKAGRSTLVYQITEDKRYCIGRCYGEIKKGWKEFPFKFDVHIVAEIIDQHLRQFPLERDVWDGGYNKGFLMEAIPESLGSECDGIIEPFYGLVTFRPFTCFYSK